MFQESKTTSYLLDTVGHTLRNVEHLEFFAYRILHNLLGDFVPPGKLYLYMDLYNYQLRKGKSHRLDGQCGRTRDAILINHLRGDWSSWEGRIDGYEVHHFSFMLGC